MAESTVDITEAAPIEAPVDAPPPPPTSPTRPLSLNFRFAQATYYEIESSNLPSSDASLQKRVLAGLALCEAALLQVEKQSIFSPNELADDINTTDLKYLLLPYYRGDLTLRVVDQPKRLEALREALKCLRGFVADQERLGLLAPEALGWQQHVGTGASDPATVRTQKIARLKAAKAAKQQLEAVRAKLAKRRGGGDEDEDDEDDLEREQAMLLLRSAVHSAVDSIRASEQEADMLTKIERMRQPDGSLPRPQAIEEEDPRLGLQMLSMLPPPGVDATADVRMAGHGVMAGGGAGVMAGGGAGVMAGGGAGNLGGCSAVYNPLGLVTVDPMRDSSSRLSYATAMRQVHTGEIPGLYTYTVEEGMRIEEAERAMDEAARMDQMSQRAEAREAAKAIRQEGNDEEDEEERQKLIKQDEFRDMHKRGSGNRKNRN